MKPFRFLFLCITILTLSTLFSCSDDDDTKPITLINQESTTIRLSYPNEDKYTFSLQGGDGTYSVKSADEKIVKAEMISDTEFNLSVIALGETTVSIIDKSQNTLTLDIITDYSKTKLVVTKHDILIVGKDLTENDKEKIKEKYLTEIPVKVGGGYEFIYTDAPNNCKAIIYTDKYGSDGVETTFTWQNSQNTESLLKWAYEITIKDEKRLFFYQRYYPTTRSSPPFVPVALYEDITKKIQAEYPKVESVLTCQVVESAIECY